MGTSVRAVDQVGKGEAELVHVVSKRLVRARVDITLNTYAHVLPDMQRQAAAKMGTPLHG